MSTVESGGETGGRGADQAGELSWDEFEVRLARVLGRMAADSFLLLAVACGDCNYFVVFAQGGQAGFRAEAVGNAYLQGNWALSPAKEQQLVDLGWRRPSGQHHNFVRDWDLPAPFEEIAKLAVQSLREVYEVERPAGLAYRRFSRNGPDFAEPTLGIAAEKPRTPRATGTPAAPTIDQVAPLVEEALRVFLGVEELERDRDGDIPIRAGSAMLFVRTVDSVPPIVSIFSPVLVGVERSPDLLEALNEINDRVMFGRVFWHGGNVVAMTELMALRISPEQIAFACLELGALADRLDDDLRERFGGRRLTDEPKRLLN
jgi:T3SS (YopN, CesT) and YbjN peptide-binding chaperone 1/T3SS (YopN, CesT) and YbjN peptide-binding chaperone 3